MDDDWRRDVFNSVYASADMYYGWKPCQEFKDFVKQMDLAGKRVLDLGCGEGRYALYLAQRGCDVTAVDMSQVGLEKLARIAECRQLDVACVLENLRDYNFSEHRYDIVIAATVLGQLEVQSRRQVIKGIKESLKIGGIVYVSIFTVDDPGCQARMNSQSEQGDGKSAVSDTSICIEHYFRAGELKAEFNDLDILYYWEGVQKDVSHGAPHYHGLARMIARKTEVDDGLLSK